MSLKKARITTQDNTDVVVNCAEAHHMPLLIKKSCVVHCGRNQLNHAYTLCELPMASVNKIIDLGVIKSSNPLQL